MITIIASTNRKNSDTSRFADHYADLLRQHSTVDVQLLKLEEIPHDWFHPDMYSAQKQTPSLAKLQDQYVLGAEKFVFIIPEYNGSFPGSLKLFLDACSIRKYKESFKWKKAALVGVASGRAGNLRGMDHFADVLNHVGSVVLPNKLPISKIGALIDEQGKISDEGTNAALKGQIEEFLAF